MSGMVQGDAYSLAVTVKNNGQAVEIDDIEKIEMTLLYLQKYYPGQIRHADEGAAVRHTRSGLLRPVRRDSRRDSGKLSGRLRHDRRACRRAGE